MITDGIRARGRAQHRTKKGIARKEVEGLEHLGR
ncbi:hypothetical protein NOCARDAX2BIS_220132 [Nocardioides sp. AX2bis]|nr:hypothetical protein NOCARDAX2BIS_220132 [Nocardioides sp. AX2bis]